MRTGFCIMCLVQLGRSHVYDYMCIYISIYIYLSVDKAARSARCCQSISAEDNWKTNTVSACVLASFRNEPAPPVPQPWCSFSAALKLGSLTKHLRVCKERTQEFVQRRMKKVRFYKRSPATLISYIVINLPWLIKTLIVIW